MLPKKLKRLSDMQLIALGFLLLILGGTCLLMLPCSSRTGEFTPFITALFTATSATCVTGLILVDTYTHWSFFGQLVLLLLIQIGGYYHRNCCFPGAAQENRSQRTRLDQGKFQCIRYRRRSTADQTCIKGNRTI